MSWKMGRFGHFTAHLALLSHNYQKKMSCWPGHFQQVSLMPMTRHRRCHRDVLTVCHRFGVCDLMEQEEDLPTFEVSMQNYVENLSEQWQAKSPLDLRSPSFSPTNVGCDGSPTSDGSTLEPSISIPTVARQAEQAISPGSLGHPEVCRRQMHLLPARALFQWRCLHVRPPSPHAESTQTWQEAA